jgi:methyl-accepting chemotaxis protein
VQESLKEVFMKLSDLFKRRQVVINPQLQYGIVGFFIFLSLINISFFLAAIYFSQNSLMETILSLDESAQKVLLGAYIEQSKNLLMACIYFSLFSLCLAVIMGVVLLNHVAGPAYAIKKFLEGMLSGDMTRAPLHFRKHDFFSDISELLNKVAREA